MKLLSSDTTLEAQQFLIERLQAMPLERKYAVTMASIQAGFNLHSSEPCSLNPFDIAHEVTSFLESERIEYFIGGSLASTTYGEPRFTQGIDIIVRLNEQKIERLVDRFQPEFYVSAPALLEAVRKRTSANLIHLDTNFRVDLMISRERGFEKSRFSRRVRKTATGKEFWFCTAEDIVLVKLEWYRQNGEVLEGQLRDVQMVLMVQDSVDTVYLTKWAATLGLSDLLERSLQDAGINYRGLPEGPQFDPVRGLTPARPEGVREENGTGLPLDMA